MEKKEKKIRIVRHSEVPSLTPEGEWKTEVVLNILLEDMSTMIVRIPEDELTDARVQEEVRKKTAKRDEWQGKELTY
uniref:Uncharacterized protein n=1 Tax=viral metagenome TaxID=1070528 RepID=A0A6H2A2Q9_9ZZZZ